MAPETNKHSPAERFAAWLEQGPRLADEAGCYVAIKVTPAKTTKCKHCNGTGTVAEYVGSEMRAVEAECSDCCGTGRTKPAA